MGERDRAGRYLTKFQKEHPNAFVYNIPDNPVGRKPFDAVIFYRGQFVAIEFKMEGGKLKPHQKDALMRVRENGGLAKTVFFGQRGVSKEIVL